MDQRHIEQCEEVLQTLVMAAIAEHDNYSAYLREIGDCLTRRRKAGALDAGYLISAADTLKFDNRAIEDRVEFLKACVQGLEMLDSARVSA